MGGVLKVGGTKRTGLLKWLAAHLFGWLTLAKYQFWPGLDKSVELSIVGGAQCNEPKRVYF